jgi:hypothetical protein
VTDPKEITGVLWFSDHEPRVFGHLQIGTAHYEIAGIRRSDRKTDLTGRKVPRKTPIPQTPVEPSVDQETNDHDKWRALGPVKQAGIRCKDPVFWAWLAEDGPGHSGPYDEGEAAAFVRTYCNVLTRGDLGKPGFSDQRILWFNLDQKFQAWRAKENA